MNKHLGSPPTAERSTAPVETYELFERVEPKDGPYSWMVWEVRAMTDVWFQTRKEAEKYIASNSTDGAERPLASELTHV